jgi:hypothetical protein
MAEAQIIRRAVKSDSTIRGQLRMALPLSEQNVLTHEEMGSRHSGNTKPLCASFIANIYEPMEIRAWWNSLDLSSVGPFAKAQLFAQTMGLLAAFPLDGSKDWLVSQWPRLDQPMREAILDHIGHLLTPALYSALGPTAQGRRPEIERRKRMRAIERLAYGSGTELRAAVRLMTLMGSATQPRSVVFPLPDLEHTGCELNVYDLPGAVIAAPKGRLGSFDASTGFARAQTGTVPARLRFTAWQLFHAAKKSELAGSFTADVAERKAWGMALDQFDLFEWRATSLRLRSGGVLAVKDASRTYFAGRFGEAVLHLVMMDKGYVYWDHIPSLCDRALRKMPVDHEERLRRARVIKTRLADLRQKAKRSNGGARFDRPA